MQETPTNPTPDLLTLDDLTALLQISKSTLRRMIAAGEIRAVKIGRVLRVRRADYDAYLAALGNKKGG